jgi:hypothetical protein
MHCLAMPFSGADSRTDAGLYRSDRRPFSAERPKYRLKLNQRALCFWNI